MKKKKQKIAAHKTAVKDLGMTCEEAVSKSVYMQCYQILGKYYTAATAHTAPAVLLGQCPICGEFSWDEAEDADIGSCKECGFVG